MGIHRGDDGVEFIMPQPDKMPEIEKFKEELKKQLIMEHVPVAMVMADLAPVVRCKDCKHCRLLNDHISFECQEWEMAFYAPTYNAATFYCADGKRRDEPCT